MYTDYLESFIYDTRNPENVKKTLQGRKIGFSKKEIDALFNLGFIPLKANPSAKPKKKSELEKAFEF